MPVHTTKTAKSSSKSRKKKRKKKRMNDSAMSRPSVKTIPLNKL